MESHRRQEHPARGHAGRRGRRGGPRGSAGRDAAVLPPGCRLRRARHRQREPLQRRHGGRHSSGARVPAGADDALATEGSQHGQVLALLPELLVGSDGPVCVRVRRPDTRRRLGSVARIHRELSRVGTDVLVTGQQPASDRPWNRPVGDDGREPSEDPGTAECDGSGLVYRGVPRRKHPRLQAAVCASGWSVRLPYLGLRGEPARAVRTDRDRRCVRQQGAGGAVLGSLAPGGILEHPACRSGVRRRGAGDRILLDELYGQRRQRLAGPRLDPLPRAGRDAAESEVLLSGPDSGLRNRVLTQQLRPAESELRQSAVVAVYRGRARAVPDPGERCAHRRRDHEDVLLFLYLQPGALDRSGFGSKAGHPRIDHAAEPAGRPVGRARHDPIRIRKHERPAADRFGLVRSVLVRCDGPRAGAGVARQHCAVLDVYGQDTRGHCAHGIRPLSQRVGHRELSARRLLRVRHHDGNRGHQDLRASRHGDAPRQRRRDWLKPVRDATLLPRCVRGRRKPAGREQRDRAREEGFRRPRHALAEPDRPGRHFLLRRLRLRGRGRRGAEDRLRRPDASERRGDVVRGAARGAGWRNLQRRLCAGLHSHHVFGLQRGCRQVRTDEHGELATRRGQPHDRDRLDRCERDPDGLAARCVRPSFHLGRLTDVPSAGLEWIERRPPVPRLRHGHRLSAGVVDLGLGAGKGDQGLSLRRRRGCRLGRLHADLSELRRANRQCLSGRDAEHPV